MALIKCKNCGEMISDKAELCPKCKSSITNEELIEKKCNKSMLMRTIIIGIVCFLCGIIVGACLFQKKVEDPTSTKVENQNVIDESINQDTEVTEKDGVNGTLKVSKKNLHPEIYNKDGLEVVFGECYYAGNGADFKIILEINNKTDSSIFINMDNIQINGATFKSMFDNSELDPGMKVISCYYVSGDDLVKSEIGDLETVSLRFYGLNRDGDDVFGHDMEIDTDVISKWE